MGLDFSTYFEAFKSANCLFNYNIQLMIKQETSFNWPLMTKSHSYSLLVKQQLCFVRNKEVYFSKEFMYYKKNPILTSQKNELGLAPSNERKKVKRSQRTIICNSEHLDVPITWTLLTRTTAFKWKKWIDVSAVIHNKVYEMTWR